MGDKINDGGPAFPVQEFNADGTPATLMLGMTLRDYLAAKALQGLMSTPDKSDFAHQDDMSAACYIWADAMLRARTGGQS
jgi:hypothetical protein